MLLITIFVELRVVAGRSRTRAGSRLLTAVLCRGLEKNGMVRAWHVKCESDMVVLCKSNGMDTL